MMQFTNVPYVSDVIPDAEASVASGGDPESHAVQSAEVPDAQPENPKWEIPDQSPRFRSSFVWDDGMGLVLPLNHLSMPFLLLLSLLLLSSCSAQETTTPPPEIPAESFAVPDPPSPQEYQDPFADLNVDAQLMLVMRRVFQDSREILWFVGDGVFRYDGDSLIDFSEHEVFRRTVVRQMAEDQKGNLWFATLTGLVKYEPSTPEYVGTFRNYTDKDGLIGNDVWSMEIDSKGIIWIGTLDGISRFDGVSFTHFVLPETKPDDTRGVTSPWIVHSIMEDSKGKIWFATNGGAYIHDPSSGELSHISEKDGLCHDVVNDILEDRSGNIWFTTHHNGVCRWDPSMGLKASSFTHISAEAGISNTEAWSLYEDRSGNIWFPIEHEGIYRYNPTTGELTNFHKEEGLPMNAVHSIIEDQEGRFWLCGFGGLYRYDSTATEASFVNMTREGPW